MIGYKLVSTQLERNSQMGSKSGLSETAREAVYAVACYAVMIFLFATLTMQIAEVRVLWHWGSIGAVLVLALIGASTMDEDSTGYDHRPFAAFAFMAIAAGVWLIVAFHDMTELLASLVFVLGGVVGALVNSGYKRR